MNLKPKHFVTFANRVRHMPSGCMEWTGHKDKDGYGVMGIGKKSYKAHRVSLFMALGYLPDDKIVCHKCDNPSCVNLAHLFFGTHKINNDDMIKKGRQRAGGKPHPGEKNGRAIISEKQAKEILKLAGQVTQVEIAKRYGLSRSAVQKLITGRAWACLKDKREKGNRANVRPVSLVSSSGKILKKFASCKEADAYFQYPNGSVWRSVKLNRPYKGKNFA